MRFSSAFVIITAFYARVAVSSIEDTPGADPSSWIDTPSHATVCEPATVNFEPVCGRSCSSNGMIALAFDESTSPPHVIGSVSMDYQNYKATFHPTARDATTQARLRLYVDAKHAEDLSNGWDSRSIPFTISSSSKYKNGCQ
ncbi:hypothetical protein T439DRAFT_355315 [Meredithblackwellia eburnea MCA 4105]